MDGRSLEGPLRRGPEPVEVAARDPGGPGSLALALPEGTEAPLRVGALVVGAGLWSALAFRTIRRPRLASDSRSRMRAMVPPISSGTNATRSRSASGAVWWLSPSVSRCISL